MTNSNGLNDIICRYEVSSQHDKYIGQDAGVINGPYMSVSLMGLHEFPSVSFLITLVLIDANKRHGRALDLSVFVLPLETACLNPSRPRPHTFTLEFTACV